jgi:hypothetical protein
MADHSKFIALAKKLINKEGREISFLKLAGTSVDPDRPWKGAARPAGEPPPISHIAVAMAVFLPVGSGFSKEYKIDELFKGAEQMLLTSPHDSSTVNLAEYNLVEDDGVRWRIVGVLELRPANQTVLFAMGVAR